MAALPADEWIMRKENEASYKLIVNFQGLKIF